MKSKRRGQTLNWKCPLETEYQRLKDKGFPESDVRVKVAKALAQLKCEENKQASIKDFFSVVSSKVDVDEEHRLVHSEMDEIEEDEDPEPAKESENKEPDYIPPGKSIPSNAVTNLVSDLGLQGGDDLKDVISEKESVFIVSEKLHIMLPIYDERKKSVDQSCKYYQKNSAMHNEMTAVERTLALPCFDHSLRI